MSHYRRAIAIREALVAGHPRDGGYRHDLAESIYNYSQTISGDNIGGWLEQAASERRSLDLFRKLHAESPEDLNARRGNALAELSLGDHRWSAGRRPEAEQAYSAESISRNRCWPTNRRIHAIEKRWP